jgi:hypothetical protein
MTHYRELWTTRTKEFFSRFVESLIVAFGFGLIVALIAYVEYTRYPDRHFRLWQTLREMLRNGLLTPILVMFGILLGWVVIVSVRNVRRDRKLHRLSIQQNTGSLAERPNPRPEVVRQGARERF